MIFFETLHSLKGSSSYPIMFCIDHVDQYTLHYYFKGFCCYIKIIFILDNHGEVERLKQSPDCADVFGLIKCHSVSWNEFGRELKVDNNTRESLRRDSSLDNEDRLEQVLNKWIESQCSPVTWEHVINTLSSMDLKKTASSVRDYLKCQHMINTSPSKPDINIHHYL